MPFCEIDGLRLFFHEQGPTKPDADPNDPTIVFVHGTQGNASLWAPTIDALSPHFRCAALNHRGRAPSDAPDDPSRYTIERFADDQADFIARRGYDRVMLVGWSLGVRTVLALLDRHRGDLQGRVAQVVLVGGPPSPRFGGQPLTAPAWDNPDVAAGRQCWGHTFTPVTPACWEGSQQSRATCDLEPTLPQIDAPVTILHGRHDPIAPHAAAEAMAQSIPNARLRSFDFSGHAPSVTEPGRFTWELGSLLQRLPKRPPPS